MVMRITYKQKWTEEWGEMEVIVVVVMETSNK